MRDGIYSVDVSKSKIRWGAGRITGSDQTGNISVKTGNLKIANGKIVGGIFIIDMATISDLKGSKAIENHLSGEDFFDVGKYPEAKFVLKKTEKKK